MASRWDRRHQTSRFTGWKMDSRPSQFDRRLYTHPLAWTLGIPAIALIALGFAAHRALFLVPGIALFAVSGAVEAYNRRGPWWFRALSVLVVLGVAAALLVWPHSGWHGIQWLQARVGQITAPLDRHLTQPGRHLAHGTHKEGHRG